MIIGIDASRNRSGGSKAYLIGMLAEFQPLKAGIEKVHLWTFRDLASKVPDRPWLEKHCPDDLDGSLWRQLFWQRKKLPSELDRLKCDLLFTTDASTLCHRRPFIVMSQDMLSYEAGVMGTYGFSRARLRLEVILRLQNATFRRADGVIFLTNYASQVIQESCGRLNRTAVIPHGIPREFLEGVGPQAWPMSDLDPIRCIYVSNAALYKYQWNVIQAVADLRKQGLKIELTLVGGGKGKAQNLVDQARNCVDASGEFIQQLPFVPHEQLPNLLAGSNMSIFASACENLPVTLLESMAVGLPIACSNRGPMPEVLGDAGVYFDPVDPQSIRNAVSKIASDRNLRMRIALEAKRRASLFSWRRTAEETVQFFAQVARSTTPMAS